MLSPLENALLALMIFALMIAVGCSLKYSEAKSILNQKKVVMIGLSMQYLLMPLIATALIFLLGIGYREAYIILLIACCPGGSTSNMFTFLSRGNIELSIVLTSITTICAFFMTPLLMGLFSFHMEEKSFSPIPIKNIVITLIFVLIPVVLGVLIKWKSESLATKIEKYGSNIGNICMGIMIVIWGPKLLSLLENQDIKIFFAVTLLSLFGIIIAYNISSLTKLSQKICKTLCFETGIQNAPLAFALIMLSYPKESSLEVSWIPLTYGAMSVGNAILSTLFFKFRKEHG